MLLLSSFIVLMTVLFGTRSSCNQSGFRSVQPNDSYRIQKNTYRVPSFLQFDSKHPVYFISASKREKMVHFYQKLMDLFEWDWFCLWGATLLGWSRQQSVMPWDDTIRLATSGFRESQVVRIMRENKQLIQWEEKQNIHDHQEGSKVLILSTAVEDGTPSLRIYVIPDLKFPQKRLKTEFHKRIVTVPQEVESFLSHWYGNQFQTRVYPSRSRARHRYLFAPQKMRL